MFEIPTVEFIKREETKSTNNNDDSINSILYNIIIEQKKSLMNLEDMLILLNSKSIVDKTNLIMKYINDDIIITDKALYMYMDSKKIYYKYISDDKDKSDIVFIYLLNLFDASFKGLSLKKQQNIDLEKLNGCLSSTLKKNLLKNMDRKDSIFDSSKKTINQIHFNNGYFDIKTFKFVERNKSDYITYCIDRDFNMPKQEKINIVYDVLKQIFPHEEDRNKNLECLGEGLTGEAPKSQYNLFLLGRGSNGKTTLMKLLQLAFENYIFIFKEDTFSINNQKADRILNMFMYRPQIRIGVVNELVGKINDSLFKQVCEGTIQTTSLFTEGMNEIVHNALMVITMNSFPNIKIDGGVIRRIVASDMKSLFTVDKSEVDEKKNIYLKNFDLLSIFGDDEELKNALTIIMLKYAHDFTGGKRYAISANMKETKQDIISSNDVIGKFCTENIILTECQKDKLKLDDVYNEFKNKNKTTFITLTQFSTYFKDKYHAHWNADVRFGKSRGGFIKMQFYLGDEDDEDEEKISPLDANITIQPPVNNNETLIKENAELKNEIEQLKKQIEILTVKPEVKSEVKSEVKLTVEDAIKKFEKDVKSSKSNNKKNKSIFSLEELQKKVKEDNKPKQIPIEDIDDGYITDDLELEFKNITKELKSKK